MANKRDDDVFRLGDLPEELSERGREVWLAGLGALATVEEEGSKLFNSLVQRGEKMEQRGKETVEEGRKQLDEAVQEAEERQREASKSVGGSVNRAEDLVSRTMQQVMERFDVPSRKEVMNLAERVELLSKQIDELSISLETERRDDGGASVDAKVSAKSKTTYHVQPRDEGWALIKEGSERATSTHETKKEAVDSGRELAKNNAPSLLVIHKTDGEVQETLSYEETD